MNAPPDSLYMGLGWDEDATSKKKHYRKFYSCALEKQKDVMLQESPFNQYDIKMG